jgi:hypothetical protein
MGEVAMGELLPVMLGAAVGVTAASMYPLARRAVALPLACVLAGALASAVNGELAEGTWALFVSFDAALAWVSALLVAGALALRARGSQS